MVGNANANANGVPFIKNGTSFLKDNIVLWYDLKRQGATNKNMANNPILKDLSGNGHDATCYNFTWNRQSGISSYFNFISLKRNNWEKYVKDVTETSFIYHHPGNEVSVMVNSNNYVVYPFQIKVTGITDTGLRLEYGQGSIPETESSIKTDGVYTITRTAYGGFKLYGDESITCNIKIEQIAYPNALVADGVDDYCIVEELPILTNYTVIAKRKRLDADLTNRGALASKMPGDSNNGAFLFELIQADTGVEQVVSFGAFNNIQMVDTDTSYMTKNSYNGTTINAGNLPDTDYLNLFKVRNSTGGCAQAALYSFILFDRTLTDEEINWVKHNLIEGDVEI